MQENEQQEDHESYQLETRDDNLLPNQLLQTTDPTVRPALL
jgi:hypothetical protein